MQHPSPFKSFLAVALVVANVIGLYYLVQMKGQIDQLQAAVSYQAGLRSDVSGLRSEIASLRQGQEWISPVDISVDSQSKDSISLLATWQIKDFVEGSSVTFYWQGPEDEGFKEVAGERLGGGRFQAKMEEPASIMPEVIVSSGSGADEALSKAPVNPLNGRPVSYTYFVAVKAGETVRSTDTRTMDLSKLYSALTYRLSMSVTSDSKKMTISVTETPNSFTKPTYGLESASLEGYSGASKVLDLTLLNSRTTKASTGSYTVEVPVFEAEMSKPATALSALWLNLTYSDGQAARVELAPASLW